MSFDGLSQSDPRPSGLGRRVPEIETFVRRGTSDASPSANLQRRKPNFSVSQQRRYPRFVPAANITQALFDLVLIGGAQSLVLSLIYARLALGGPIQAIVVIGISTFVSFLFLHATGCYRRDALLSRTTALSRVPPALVITGATLFVILHYGLHLVFPTARVFLSVSRCVTIILVASSIAMGAVILSRGIVRVMLHRELFRRRILVVGTGKRAQYIEELSRANGSLQEMHFVGEELLNSFSASDKSDRSGATPSISDLADRLFADEIVVAVENRQGVALDGLLSCKVRGVPVTEFNSFVERQTGRIEMEWLELPWLIHTRGFQFRLLDDVLKRSMDITLSLIALIVSLPVLLVAMIAIRLDSPGPVIYRQQRVTRGGESVLALQAQKHAHGCREEWCKVRRQKRLAHHESRNVSAPNPSG